MLLSSRSSLRSSKSARKVQIVEAILELVAKNGTEAVSVQLVADAIGVTQPAVFRHFSTKEAMWLAVMDWLEQRLIAIYSAARGDANASCPVVLSRIFLDHMKLIERYPALAKLVFADHLRLQYPSLHVRFSNIHRAYMARLVDVIECGKSAGVISRKLDTKGAATAFLSLVQGLGFQSVIARLQLKLLPEAKRVLTIYLQAITTAKDEAGSARKHRQAGERSSARE